VKKKLLTLFLGLVIIIQLFQIIFFNRSLFLQNYDASYWKDRFEHSQWQMPLSKRIIGDDGLYSYVGLNLGKSVSPDKFNPETPPVGKYLIGLSILIFKNTIYYSLIIGLITLLLYFMLVKIVLRDRLAAIFATTLLLLDPMFFSQFWTPWLDMLQLLFLFSGLICVFLIEKGKYRLTLSIIAGFSLGLFTQTKFPILLPAILIFETYIFIKNKFIKDYFVYLVSFCIGLILPYFQYFLLGNTLIDFLKLEKYIISFYLKSGLLAHYQALSQSLLIGSFPLIVGKGVSRIYEWTLLWPISVAVSLFLTIKFLFTNNNQRFLKYLGILMFVFIIVFSLVPFYPRYLLMVLPFAYILLVFFVKNFTKGKLQAILFVAMLIYGAVNSYIFLFPKSDVLLNDFYYNFSNQYFQDIYQEDLANRVQGFNRGSFFKLTKNAMSRAQVNNISIKELDRSMSLLSNKGKVKISVTYRTQNLGNFSEEKTIQLVKINSQWKINWDWNILLNGFIPGYFIKTTVNYGKRGSIVKNGKILAADTAGYLISINPSKIDLRKEQEMLDMLGALSGLPAIHIQNAYLENVIPDTFVPVLTTSEKLSDKQIEKLKEFPGLNFYEYPTRIYDGTEISPQSVKNFNYNEFYTRLYSAYNYKGSMGLEKEYDDTLFGFSGGNIKIVNKDEEIIRTIINKDIKNGKDVNLPL
jgi:hypothetical protein